MFLLQASELSGLGIGSLSRNDPRALADSIGQQFDLLQRVLTGCGPLDHDLDQRNFEIYNGNLNISNGSITFGTGGTAEGIMRLATATANWTSGSPSYVATTDDLTGAAVTIYLLAPSTSVAPNVRSGQQVGYMYSSTGVAYAVTGYLDDAINCIKIWSGSIASIPQGWALCNGSSGTPDLRDRFLQGAGNLAVGATGGAETHDHGAATGAAAPSTDSQGAHTHTGLTGGTAPSTDTQGAHDHGAATGSASPTTDSQGAHDHGAATGSASPGTDTQGGHTHTVDLTTPGEIVAAGVGGVVAMDTSYTSGSDGLHSHTVNSHTHSITSGGAHTHTVTSHTHSITSSGGHSHTVASHTHSISSDGGHTHTVASHTHSISSVNHEPPWYALAYIMRVD